MNGTCVGPDDCQCNDGYRGEMCDVPICLGGSDCMGFCNVPGECICNDGYTGVLCDERLPSESPPTEATEEPDNGNGSDGLSAGGKFL